MTWPAQGPHDDGTNLPRWASRLGGWGRPGTLLGRLKERRVPVVDPSYGDPRLAEIRSAARNGDAGRWPAVREVLAAARDQEDLTFLLSGIEETPGAERWIEEVVAERPDDALALVAGGARQVGWARQACEPGQAATASQEPAELFRTRLETAEARLFDAAERQPEWAAPWYFLQVSGRGLEVGPQEAERRFGETCRRAPGHVAAYRQQVRRLSAQGGGSHERVLEFARQATRDAPAGSGVGQIVALAHLEVWRATPEEGAAVMCTPQVIRDLHESASRSVHHPAFVRERDWAVGVNLFALAFALAGEQAAARVMFRKIGKNVTRTPWTFIDGRSPVVPFLEWRSRVGA